MQINSRDQSDSAIRPRGILTFSAVFMCALLFLVLGSTASLASIIFSENMGNPSSTTPINSFSGWQNNGALTFGGTGDVRTSSASGGYAGGSGDGNVFLTTGGTKSFIIGSINTLGYSSLSVSFGAYKSTTASTMSELAFSYSIDGGSTYLPFSIPVQPTGTGTAVWRLISLNLLPSAEGVSDLRLQWINTSPSTVQFRLDDITLVGTVVPEPSTFIAGVLLALPFGVQGIRCLQNRKRA